tara:strand:- start:23600 stop:23998 length:399 start_codon:yes stop_codon:yes gene_type:complete
MGTALLFFGYYYLLRGSFAGLQTPRRHGSRYLTFHLGLCDSFSHIQIFTFQFFYLIAELCNTMHFFIGRMATSNHNERQETQENDKAPILERVIIHKKFAFYDVIDILLHYNFWSRYNPEIFLDHSATIVLL